MPRFSPLCLLLAGLLLTAPLAVAPVLAQEEPAAGESETGPDGEAESPRPAPPGRPGLPLPRFVTLRADPVNLPTGPGRTDERRGGKEACGTRQTRWAADT